MKDFASVSLCVSEGKGTVVTISQVKSDQAFIMLTRPTPTKTGGDHSTSTESFRIDLSHETIMSLHEAITIYIAKLNEESKKK